ncbi:MAG: PH domain-containing protein [Actinomycetota bacterium]|nr:PH domain-containing protein [Actinomycetota bacterium]
MSEQQVPSRLVFRVPTIAVLAALLLVICVTPLAFAAPGLVALYLIPIALILWLTRVRTTADAEGLAVRQVFSTTTLPWESLKGLRLTKDAKVRAVRADDSEVRLPSVRVRHLPALAMVSAGRLDDPTEGSTGEAEDDTERVPPAE